MNCTECGGKTETLDTRFDELSNSTRRRRQCKACGHRFATIEAVAPERVAVRPVVKTPKAKTLPRPHKEREHFEQAAMLDSAWTSVPSRLNSLEDLDYL